MKRCYYCNSNAFETHAYNCPINRTLDTRHANASLESEYYYPEPTYDARLKFGFQLLHDEEEYITDKFGNTRPSGY